MSAVRFYLSDFTAALADLASPPFLPVPAVMIVPVSMPTAIDVNVPPRAPSTNHKTNTSLCKGRP